MAGAVIGRMYTWLPRNPSSRTCSFRCDKTLSGPVSSGGEKEEATSSLENPLIDSVHVRPPAAARLQALRGLGYSPWAAMAALIDNSISAGAANVWIEFHWAGKHSFISILDDGSGIKPEKLISAMTLGSIDPRAFREACHLG